MAALVAVDALAVLAAASVLSAAHHDLRLVLPVVALVLVLDGQAGLYRPARTSGPSTSCPRWAPAPGSPGAWRRPRSPRTPRPGDRAAAALRRLPHAPRPGVPGPCRAARAAAPDRPRAAPVGARHRRDGAARRFAAAAAQHPEYGMRPVGIVGVPEQGGIPGRPGGRAPVLTTTEEIHRAVIQNAVRDAVFLDDEPGLVSLFQQYGCATWRAAAAAGRADGRAHVGYALRRVVPLRERPGQGPSGPWTSRSPRPRSRSRCRCCCCARSRCGSRTVPGCSSGRSGWASTGATSPC
ncbi:hypothetical protein O1L60_24630 [Streptomyces diastatochromogenes]|nr:hypothetical protein [Streptomyces diastatochromogenes]